MDFQEVKRGTRTGLMWLGIGTSGELSWMR